MALSSRAKDRLPNGGRFDSLHHLDFDTVPTVGVAALPAAVQSRLAIPASMKIWLVVFSWSGINTNSGTHQANIVYGPNPYSTGSSTNATNTFTVTTPAPVVGLRQSIMLNGVVLTYTTVAGDSTPTGFAANLATFLNAAVNADVNFSGRPLNQIFQVQNTTGVGTITVVDPGVLGNTYTLSIPSNSNPGNYTIVAGTPNFVGGVNNTGIVVAPQDTYDATGAFTFAAPSNALWANDIGLGGGGTIPDQTGTIKMPTYDDAIYPQGSVLTLRVTTPAVTGSITNLKCSLFCKFTDTKPGQPAGGQSFSPILHI